MKENRQHFCILIKYILFLINLQNIKDEKFK